jgi:exodeoxyribonuclease-3
MGKGLLNYITETDADILAIQETKMNTLMSDFPPRGYTADWNCGERLGYSGTVCLYKKQPLSIRHGFGEARFDAEGRLITLEYPSFYFVNAYVPNSQGGLDRWYYRLDWDAAFAEYLEYLQGRKPVIVAGDFNVARDYIDIFPENLRNDENPPGFLSEERDGLNALLDMGLSDVFRNLHPTQERAYTWWSNRLNKRAENRGWRIDYFLVSESLMPRVESCEIRSDVYGSDHAPVELTINL